MTEVHVTPAMFDSAQALEAAGFTGFAAVGDLARSGCLEVPVARGVFLLVRDSAEAPKFMPGSAAGMFRGQRPHVKVEVLEERWVPGAAVLYAAEAGGTGVRGQLQQRIKRMIRFGSGKSIAAWGGRYVWQLTDHRRLLFAWAECDDPAEMKAQILEAFENRYGMLPFANLEEEREEEDPEEP